MRSSLTAAQKYVLWGYCGERMNEAVTIGGLSASQRRARKTLVDLGLLQWAARCGRADYYLITRSGRARLRGYDPWQEESQS